MAQAVPERILDEARHLRDHVLRSGAVEVDALVAALRPFETGTADASETQVRDLYVAFQRVHAEARRSIDDHTLSEVLKGRSPHIYRPSPFGSVCLALFGVFLVGLALHFSYWSNRTSAFLAEAVDFLEYDQFEEVSSLVTFEDMFSRSDESVYDGTQIRDLDPYWLYIERRRALASHLIEGNRFPRVYQKLYLESNPFVSVSAKLRRLYCGPTPANGVKYGSPVKDLVCPSGAAPAFQADPDDSEIAKAVVPRISGEGGGSGNGANLGELTGAIAVSAAGHGDDKILPFRESLLTVDKRFEETMIEAGWSPASDYLLTLSAIDSATELLRGLLDNAHRWWLPIIYGALGSVVYCMWRILSPDLAGLGFLHTVLRTAFAGLAALTLSMLLIPSNALGLGAETSRPLIYLLSFGFGYSIEVFVSVLNRLNQFAAQNLAPKNPQKPGEPAK